MFLRNFRTFRKWLFQLELIHLDEPFSRKPGELEAVRPRTDFTNRQGYYGLRLTWIKL